MHIALQAQKCDSVVTAQDHYIKAGLKYEAAQDSVMVARSIMIANLQADTRDWESRFNNQVAMTKIQKKKKRRWVLISAGLLALGIYTNIP